MTSTRFYILLLALCACLGVARGQDNNPNDAQTATLTLRSLPASVLGTPEAVTYEVGYQVPVSAPATSGLFTFVCWTNAQGEVLSQEASFTYVMQAGDQTLTARYRFNPANPAEPDAPQASGSYTLSLTESGARNFTSLAELVSFLSQSAIADAIQISVPQGGTFALDAVEEQSPSRLLAMRDNLVAAKQGVAWSAPADAPATLNFQVPTESLSEVAQLVALFTTDNVTIQLNGAAISPALLQPLEAQQACSGVATQEVDFDALATDERLVVSWYASVQSGESHLSGYEAIGTGNIPAMTLANSGTTAEVVSYHITIALDGTELWQDILRITVRPSITTQTFSTLTPADAYETNTTSVALRWSNPGNLATSYTLIYSKGDEMPSQVELTKTSYTLQVERGNRYQWQVVAHGPCDDLASPSRAFRVRELSDLVPIAIEAPDSVRSKSNVVLTATIQNQGLEGTLRTDWYDALYSSPNADGTKLTSVKRVRHQEALEVGDSYVVTFEFTAPEVAEDDTLYYYIKADDYGYETESDESNNLLRATAATRVCVRTIHSDDLAALRVLYEATGGEAWKKQWQLSITAPTSAAWPGVTFNDEDRVTAITLERNNMEGQVPAEGFALPLLEKLDLSNNALSGDVAQLCASLPALATLDLSYNSFEALSEPLSPTITSLDLSYQCSALALSDIEPAQQWTLGVPLADVALTPILSYDHAAQAFTAHPTLAVKEGSSTRATLSWNGQAYVWTTSGTYATAQATEMSATPTSGIARGNRLHAIVSWLLGDANVDGMVDVLDAQTELNQILGTRSGNYNFLAANVYDSDEIINVQDIVATINLFLDMEEGDDDEAEDAANGTRAQRLRRLAPAAEADARLQVTADGRLVMSHAEPVGALDITLAGVEPSQVALAMNRTHYQLITRATPQGTRLVIISPSGREIAPGETTLLRLPATARVAQATAASPQAERMRVSASDVTVGIEAPQAERPTGAAYDLSGRRTSLPAARGIYIINGKKQVK